MKSHEISRSKIGPFSLACTDPYVGIGWEYQSKSRFKTVFALLWVCMIDFSDSCIEGVKIRIEDKISWKSVP